MTAKIIPFTPAEYNRDDAAIYHQGRLEMAWNIIHAPMGKYKVAYVIAACDFLEEHGDWCDVERAREVRKALTAEIGEPTPRSLFTLDSLFALAMVALTAGLLIGALSVRFM